MSKKKTITLKDKYPNTEYEIGGKKHTMNTMEMIHRTNNKLLRNEWCWLDEVSYDQFVEGRKSTSFRDFQISEDMYDEIHNIGMNSGMYGRTHMMWNIFNDIMIIISSTPNKDVKDEVNKLVEPLFNSISNMFDEVDKQRKKEEKTK